MPQFYLRTLEGVNDAAQAEAEAERDALDARKRADKARREAEAAQAEAEAERDALDARKRADKARREAEADAAAAQVAAEATQIINQGETMNEQNIEIGTQVISSGHEYTVIDETPTTIVYEDESGKMYVEEKHKTNIFMWLGLGLLIWKILK